MVLWLKYEPQELVDTSNLSSEEWLSYRRRGIGGSDAAAILGISPWRTARDLYYDKLNVVKADVDENWVALEMGHLLEDSGRADFCEENRPAYLSAEGHVPTPAVSVDAGGSGLPCGASGRQQCHFGDQDDKL